MSIQLSSAVEDKVSELVETWKYPDASSLVERALELLNDHETLISLRAKIQLGLDDIEQGNTVPYSQELRKQIRESAQRRYADGERAGPDVRP